MKEIKIEIVTPSKIAFEGNVKSITIPGTKGSFQVLFNHAPLMSSFEVGFIKIETLSGEITNYATSGGTVEVLNNKVIVLAESFESKEQIDIKRAEEALSRAKDRIKIHSSGNNIDTIRAEFALRRAINRLKLAK
ncbi:MAG: ATP synthase F1 subunit epsilon [Bacteroidetes bacterium]|nr:ATP synthase F1 subunit epsilon [Bacteroidota bacterium]MBU1114476.1 ATP synthase F1 subunit epsilon [Bacteroidota bacterium]MBU1796937.1 ATP synthase F1 subunit epsilon [Bacteroidota bacterium]